MSESKHFFPETDLIISTFAFCFVADFTIPVLTLQHSIQKLIDILTISS